MVKEGKIMPTYLSHLLDDPQYVPKIRIKKMFRLPKVEDDHDKTVSELLDKAGLVVIALLLLVAKHLLNIKCVVC